MNTAMLSMDQLTCSQSTNSQHGLQTPAVNFLEQDECGMYSETGGQFNGLTADVEKSLRGEVSRKL